MACRRNLLSIDFHYDDESGMYQIGEIDTGISGELGDYLKRYGDKGLSDILKGLAYLSGQVFEEFLKQKNHEVSQDMNAKPQA